MSTFPAHNFPEVNKSIYNTDVTLHLAKTLSDFF